VFGHVARVKLAILILFRLTKPPLLNTSEWLKKQYCSIRWSFYKITEIEWIKQHFELKISSSISTLEIKLINQKQEQ
jgi:hypothetical protein